MRKKGENKKNYIFFSEFLKYLKGTFSEMSYDLKWSKLISTLKLVTDFFTRWGGPRGTQLATEFGYSGCFFLQSATLSFNLFLQV